MPLTQPPIAAGRTAEIFAWDDDSILKLVRPGFPAHLADQEWCHARLAFDLGARAPQPVQLLEVDGRRGVVFRRIHGDTMTSHMRRALLRPAHYARLLARLHAELHVIAAPTLPAQIERARRNLQQSTYLPALYKQPLLNLLERLPDSDGLVHGDFHCENVLLTAGGPLIIDWEGSMHGPPAADVANTLLWIRAAMTYGVGFNGWLMRLYGRRFEHAYLHEYQRLAPTPLDALDAWVAILAACRLRDDTAHELPHLLPLIEQGVRVG